MLKSFVMIVPALFCVACSHTFPIAVVTKDVPGGVMRGTGTASPAGGHFSVSAGALVCAGDYDAWDHSRTITIPIVCNDGRKGLVTATRNDSLTGGGGRFTLNDGSTGDFIFGPAAARL